MEKILLEKLVGILTDQIIDLKEKLATEKRLNEYWRKERERIDAQSRENAEIRRKIAEYEAIRAEKKSMLGASETTKEESKR